MEEDVIILTEEDIVNTEEITVEESAGWVGGDVGRHDSLDGRNDPEQHEITAIAGLRSELDDIKKLKAVYSDKIGHANYYKWDGDHAYNKSGYFVSLVAKSDNSLPDSITICNGIDIFGVTVDEAGFIGNEGFVETKGTDDTYGLVATSGLVKVRCVSDVEVGGYVVSNDGGFAVAASSGCGYKVIAKNNIGGTEYVTIALGVQACTTDRLGYNVQQLNDDMFDAKINIATAIAVAEQAHRIAEESKTISDGVSDQVGDLGGRVDGLEGDLGGLGGRVDGVVDDTTIIKEQIELIDVAANTAKTEANESLTKANAMAATVDVIDAWKYTDPVTGETHTGAEYFQQYVENGLSTKASLLEVSKLDEENKLLIEKNAESYTQTLSSVDKYSVGEYSQAYGLTVKQAGTILKEGMIYIPTKAHTETYQVERGGQTYTYSCYFSTNNSYVWEYIPVKYTAVEDGVEISSFAYMWNARSGNIWPGVIMPSGNDYDFWYFDDILYRQSKKNEWGLVTKLIHDGESEPTEDKYDYWIDTSKTSKQLKIKEEDEAGEKTWVEYDALIESDEPLSYSYRYWYNGKALYELLDPSWYEFDKDVSFGDSAPYGSYEYWYYDGAVHVLTTSVYSPYATFVGKTRPTEDDFDFWYNENDNKIYSRWAKVNTLAGNVNNRIVSTLRHDVGGWGADITNAKRDLVTINGRLDKAEGKIEMVTNWMLGEDGGETKKANIAAIVESAGDDGSELSLMAVTTEGTTVLHGATIVLGNTTDDDSYIKLTADSIVFADDDDEFVSKGDLSTSGTTTIHGGNIQTQTITADHIKVADLTALGATIATWEITKDEIRTGNLDKYSGMYSGNVSGTSGYRYNSRSLVTPTVDGDNYYSAIRFFAGAPPDLKDGGGNILNRAPFRVLEDGSLYAEDAEITGTITAKSGKIGGWNISNKMLENYSGDQDGDYSLNSFCMQTGDNGTNLLAIGKCSPNDWGEADFRVTKAGKLYANDAEITGTITAKSGKIGGWNLTSRVLENYSGTETIEGEHNYTYYANSFCMQIAGGSANNLLAIGKCSPGDWSKAAFIVDKNGAMYATSGQIGGWTITENAMTNYYGEQDDKGNYPYSFCMQIADDDSENLLAIGACRPLYWGDASFVVKKDGSLHASNVHITGGEIQIKSGQSTIDIGVDNGIVLYHDSAKTITVGTVEFTMSPAVRYDTEFLTFYRRVVQENSDALVFPDLDKAEATAWMWYNWEAINSYVAVLGNWVDSDSHPITSDANLKNHIEYLDDRYDDFFGNIIPKRFQYNHGTSNRYHVGYIAQDIQSALRIAEIDEKEFAGICTFGGGVEDEFLTLRYEEFVPINTWQIQKLKPRVATLEEKVQALEEENLQLKERLDQLSSL